MIKITVYKNQDGLIKGFKAEGHAGFARRGKDIVCAAVSALIETTINSVAEFTTDVFEYDVKKSGGAEIKIVSEPSEESQLLFKSMLLGISGIQEEAGKGFIHVDFLDM